MALVQEGIETIQSIVDKAIKKMPELKNKNVRYEIDLRERTIRVEEELKHQRELMLEGFRNVHEATYRFLTCLFASGEMISFVA